MPPHQQADCFLYDHDDHDDEAVVNFDNFTTDHIFGSGDNQIVVAMKGENTKQAAHRFDLLDDDDKRQETNYKTYLFPCLFQFKKKKTIAGSISKEGEEEEKEEEIEEVEVEHRVRFHGEVIEQWKDTNDGRRSVVASRVFDDAAVTVTETIIEIPHVSEYTEEEKRTMWYTRKEMIQLKQTCLHTVRDILTRHRQQHKCSAVEALYCCSFYLRGLEKFIDFQQIINMNNYNCTTSHSQNYIRTTRKTNVRRYDGIISVLGEQYNQRVECFQNHGKVKKGIVDPDRLRTVYEKEGNTQESLKEAHYLATHDERDVQEYCIEEELGSSSSSPRSDDNLLSSYHYSSDDNVDNNDDDHIIHNILMKSILRKLITPFVEVPQGDVYLGINHAESIHIQ